MITLLFAAVLSASTNKGGYPAVHPHVIKDASDAIATYCETMRAHTLPAYGKYHKDCEKGFRATTGGRFWTLRQIMATPGDPRGMHIILDARDGHTVSAVAMD